MRVSVKGKRRKPPKYKNTAETFEFKAAVLTYYDTHTMAAAIGAFGQHHDSQAETLGSAKTLSDDAELDLFEWLVAVRRNRIPVSATMLQQEALEIAKLYDVPETAFAASSTWMAAYLSRYSLSLSARTRQGQSAPADSNEFAQNFAATSLACVDSDVGEVSWDDDVG
ncbi:hypothetical protein PC118_g15196 [Phytophthora cactorum]|uniref:HTH CENPB-type domain-containing protein n=1 Tax=Phytophthora cactorum TaxID=29920 RepID=A0A8T1FIS3_9STRA|nr:hypothetical protein PC114_g15045 [Phytophthora cactorum]KAG2973306.1 hypothetical protein PC118_g15196 [Phytophthora cactorum]KAG3003122.1 hypothetical protein PC119_g16109 [Phytophthora cactorum]KAG3072644.1 hypothetical protein PC122_g15156 [Phytophthora cactorum]